MSRASFCLPKKARRRLALGLPHGGGDAIALRGRDDGAHLGAFGLRIADAQRDGGLFKGLEKLRSDRLVHQQPRRGGADLAGGPEP